MLLFLLSFCYQFDYFICFCLETLWSHIKLITTIFSSFIKY